MSIERSVVKHHVVSPAHAVENGTWSGHGANGKSGAERFAEGADIRLNSVVLLCATGSIPEPGHDLVKNEQGTALARQFANFLKITILRRNAAHVGHDGLGDDCRQLVTVPLHYSVQHGEIVPGSNDHIIKSGCRNALRIGNPSRIVAWSQLLWRMTVPV